MLRSALEVDHEVVAQEVEAELVVRAVGDLRLVRLVAGDRAQVAEPLIGRGVVGVEQEGRVVLDAADAHAKAPEHLADPLRVALGEVVVRRDDVDPSPGQAIEVGGQGRHEGLSLAGLHLGDLAPMQDHAAHQLDVVMALPEGAPHRLADRGEGLRQDRIERHVDLGQLALAPLLAPPRRGGPGRLR